MYAVLVARDVHEARKLKATFGAREVLVTVDDKPVLVWRMPAGDPQHVARRYRPLLVESEDEAERLALALHGA